MRLPLFYKQLKPRNIENFKNGHTFWDSLKVRAKGGIYFVIRNAGNSPALDISINLDPAPTDFAGRSLNDVSVFKKPISFLASEKQFRQIIDVGHKLLAEGRPTFFRSTVQYRSVFGEAYKELTEHDLEFMKQATVPANTIEESLDEISRQIKDMNSLLKSVKGANSLLVQTPEQYYSQILKDREQNNVPRWKTWLRALLEKLLEKMG